MSYSRWGSSHWYTFWASQPDGEIENADSQRFEICAVASFTGKQLREDLEGCLAEVQSIDPVGPIDELREYMEEFLQDMQKQYNASA